MSQIKLPSAQDVEELRALATDIHSLDDAYLILGKPDIERPSSKLPRYKSDVGRQLVYSSRWESLTLTVKEKVGGKVEFTYQGKYAPANDSSGLSHAEILAIGVIIAGGILGGFLWALARCILYYGFGLFP